MNNTEKPLHVQQAEGLRALADLLEQNPELAEQTRYNLEAINVPCSSADDPVATIAAFVRAGLAHGASIEKEYDSKFGGATISWGTVGIHVYTYREEVCERVVTGTETVTKQVPDPAAPLIEVTEEVEQVEWRCRPLVAAEQAPAVTP